MRDAGEAIMNMFMTNEARKPSRIGSLAIISGAMLGAVGAVGPALSADLPDDYPPYRPTYYRNYYSNDYGGYSSCYNCGQRFEQAAARPPVMEERPPVTIERPVVERIPMAERHWVQRDYIERQYPSYAATERYDYSSYPGYYRYSHDCSAPCAEPYRAYEPAPYREPRRQFSYVGAHYPPAAAAYEFENEPRAPYRYAASSHPPYDYYRPSYEPGYRPAYEYKPAYEHEPSPRPPAAVPRGYYGPGYFK
jgi:hypothetical protein